MAHRIVIFLFFILFAFFPSSSFANSNSFVTIVNPQRISEYTKDPVKSFQTQVNQVESRGLSATWPVTYDVLKNKKFTKQLHELNQDQEIGIFLEITPLLAQDARVFYNPSDSWHRANSLFTTGYTQSQRIQLIDTVFKQFKQEFGFYPKSVGAWYIDGFSLAYMQKAYGITASLNMSDQYDLDGYQLWGTPWSVPYYPSGINAAIPGDLDVLMLRWAGRDPLNGYINSNKTEPSLFSLQDYNYIRQPHEYYENLLKTYAIQQEENQFGHATVGLEGDLSADTYTQAFSTQMNIIKNLADRNLIHVRPMQDFASWYKKNVSEKIHIISSRDLTQLSKKKAYWIQSSHYRIGIVSDTESNSSAVVDFRIYAQNYKEPFHESPNKQFNLSINLPYVIDTVVDPSSEWDLGIGAVKNTGKHTLTFDTNSLKFTEDKIIFSKKIPIPDVIKNSNQLFVLPNIIKPNPHYASEKVYIDFSLDIPFTIKRRLPVWIANLLPNTHFPIPQFYTISQTEIDALKVLESLPDGDVLVYDRDCLGCGYQTKFKPAAMAGKKGYVHDLSGKPVAEDYAFSIAKTSNDARKILKDKNIKYVYLAKYEDYIETLPYLPQDLRLTKAYENANSQIWKIE